MGIMKVIFRIDKKKDKARISGRFLNSRTWQMDRNCDVSSR
jgi:hypothetical protein